MSMRIKRFFLSRTTVIALIAGVALLVLIGAIVPQRFAMSEAERWAWRTAHPTLAPVVKKFGLDHVFTTPLFAAILALSLVSLSLSSLEQFKAARRKTFGAPSIPEGVGARTVLSEGEIKRALRKQGYIRTAGGEGTMRFVKHPWGHWGNFLLHIGMVVTIAAAFFVALTQNRASAVMNVWEIQEPDEPWKGEDNGLLADSLVLPKAVRLKDVRLEFYESGTLKMVHSDITYFPGDEVHTVSISSKVFLGDISVYQSGNFGDAFHVRFTDRSGKKNDLLIRMSHPLSLYEPGETRMAVQWLPYVLRAAYYVDADRESLNSKNPELLLRLEKPKEEVVGQVSLKPGESAEMGEYEVRFVRPMKWVELIFAELKGLDVVFVGFFIMIAGGFLGYFTPPREVVAAGADGGHVLCWKPSKFKGFYDDERVKILDVLGAK